MNKDQENALKAQRYRSEQRKMGEITVAMRLMTDLLRVMPENRDLMESISHLLVVQKTHSRKLRAMEKDAGCCWSVLQ